MDEFFFSSRRRHTRLTCDWSSDVCSSDLLVGAAVVEHWEADHGRDRVRAAAVEDLVRVRGGIGPRSEERRVGKECRSRWSAYHEKKNEGKEATRCVEFDRCHISQ